MKPKFNIGDMIVEDINFATPAYCLIIGFRGDFHTQYHLHPLFDEQDKSYYMAITISKPVIKRWRYDPWSWGYNKPRTKLLLSC